MVLTIDAPVAVSFRADSKWKCFPEPIERSIAQPVVPGEISLNDPYWYVVSDKNFA